MDPHDIKPGQTYVKGSDATVLYDVAHIAPGDNPTIVLIRQDRPMPPQVMPLEDFLTGGYVRHPES